MTDGALVALLLAFIWAAILIPPAASARASREADFLGSIRPGGHPHERGALPGGFDALGQQRFAPALTANARRRQVLGGLLVAIAGTLVLGLLPPFRLLLVVHLLLVNSCLAFVGAIVLIRDQQARRTVATASRRRDLATGVDGYAAVHPYADAGDFRDLADLAPSYDDHYADEGAYAGDGRYAEDQAYESDDGWQDGDDWAEHDIEVA